MTITEVLKEVSVDLKAGNKNNDKVTLSNTKGRYIEDWGVSLAMHVVR